MMATNPKAKNRTIGQRLGDRIWTKYARLPAPTCSYTVTRGLRIPTRDGVELLADLYEPDGASSGTVLITTPYGWDQVAMFASRGYRGLLVRCRGTYGSGGSFQPFIQEVDDAADIVAWMRNQPWFEGSFATYGYSYPGWTQWALLMNPPPELAAAVIACCPNDFRAAVYDGGAFMLSQFLEWSFVMTKRDYSTPRRIFAIASARGRVKKAMNVLPVSDVADGLLDGGAPWYRDWISERDPADPLWKNGDLSQALEQVQVPVLLQGGWQDGFLRQTLSQYARLTARHVKVGLTIGPWTHADGGAKGTRVLWPEALDWFDTYLGKSRPGGRSMPVKVFVSGRAEGDWRDLPAWPPPTIEQFLFPRSGNRLAAQVADTGDVCEFTYDPAKPTPTIGGAFVTQAAMVPAGYKNDRKLSERSDVLTFTSDPLTTELEVAGSPVAELGHSSDNPFADLFVRLSEVDSKGRSRNVTDGFVRLDPEDQATLVRLELDPVAHRFAQGNRVRLIIAGGSFPRWERNLGTGEDPATSSRTRPSLRKIDLSISRIIFPVVQSVTNAGGFSSEPIKSRRA